VLRALGSIKEDMYKLKNIISIKLDEVISRLSDCGSVISRCYEISPDASPTFNFSDGGWSILSHFLKSAKDLEVGEELEKIRLSNSKKYVVLNKHEFEGSLVSNFIQGGVYEAPCKTQAEARELAGQLIDNIYPDLHSDIYIFKLIDDKWSEWAYFWAITWSYVIWDRQNNTVWYLCFGSTS
jgi:hypothetical protein